MHLNLRNNLLKRQWSTGKIDWIIFSLLFFIGIYLSYNYNFIQNHPDHLPMIYSDKADYYAYLPATFIYGWDINKFPAGIDKKCAGFFLDKKRNKLDDKTTCGVAILWTPFFLATHFIALQWNLQPDGFSDFYQRMTIVPGVFYLILGLFFLMKFLRNYYSRGISYLTIFLILVGTNLYDYGIGEGLMSHVNSFFLFSLFLFLLKKFLDQERKSYKLFVGISFAVSLAILIRPTNILLLACMIFLDINSIKDVWERVLLFLKPTYIATFIVVIIIVFLPQFIYWHYLTGHFLYYSYPGEGFINWNQPQIIPVWFSPLNGFFIYTPLAILFIAGIVVMILKRVTNGIFIGLLFLLISYVFASWHVWYFGGSFGYRPFVEYYAILAIPFGYVLSGLKTLKNLYLRSLLVLFIIISSYYNLRLTYNQEWNPFSTWSWDDFLIHLDNAGVYRFNNNNYTYKLDFENSSNIEPQYPQQNCVHSPTRAGHISRGFPINAVYWRKLDGILNAPVRRVKASLWVNAGNNLKTNSFFVCKIQDWKGNLSYFKTFKMDDIIKSPHKWYKITALINIPDRIDQSNFIYFYAWNPRGTPEIYIDDLELKFEKQ